ALSQTRRAHKERAQPLSRRRFGLLEKKKDYQQRSADYKSKQRQLKAMRGRAVARNPDEFYFGMIKSQTVEGVHKVLKERAEKVLDDDQRRLFRTQDQGYVAYKRSTNKAGLERIKESLHFVDAAVSGEASEGNDDSDDEDNAKANTLKAKKAAGAPTHVIFVDDEEEGMQFLFFRAILLMCAIPPARSFDPAKHFDTPAELLHRRFNRPRTAQLESETADLADRKTLKKLQAKKVSLLRELASRQKREAKLRKMQIEFDLRKQLL
ncbi:UTP11-like, U3 small nucleolar ribonucleoprotein, partial [Cladochytrium tenue]